MSVCSVPGASGLGSALGGIGRALGGSLGLATAVDLGWRLGTGGYGLIDSLNVPYIECGDGHFASAVEWWGHGMKCGPKPPDPPSPSGSSWGGATQPTESAVVKAAGGYADYILGLGGSLDMLIGSSILYVIEKGKVVSQSPKSGHYPSKTGSISEKDGVGNVTTYSAAAYAAGGTGQGRNSVPSAVVISGGGGNFMWNQFTGFLAADSGFSGTILGLWTFGSGAGQGRSIPLKEILIMLGGGNPFSASGIQSTIPNPVNHGLLGVRVSMPDYNNKKPVAIFTPPSSGVQSPNNDKKDCADMGCDCASIEDSIERAVKKALGLGKPYAPEKEVFGWGQKIYNGKGRSTTEVTPQSLPDLISMITATVYCRLGLQRYPLELPDSLIHESFKNTGKVDNIVKIEDQASWNEWLITQIDQLVGEFPIKIEIKDNDKSNPLVFENLSEALSEMTGMLIQAAVDADAGVNVGCHAVVEASKAGNAAIVAQYHAKALLDFFGVRTAPDSVEVKSTITPGKLDKAGNEQKKHGLVEFLTPSVQAVAILKDDDPFDFQATMQRILKNSEIARMAVFQEYNPKAGKTEVTGDYIRTQRKYNDAVKEETIKALKAEVEKIYNPPDQPAKIEISRDPTDSLPGASSASSADIAGKNFVLKRAKTNQ